MDQSKSIWIGELDGFEDENYFKTIFQPSFNIQKIKIIRKNGIKSEYAFIELQNREEAALMIKKFDNQQRPLSRKQFHKTFSNRLGSKKQSLEIRSKFVQCLYRRFRQKD